MSEPWSGRRATTDSVSPTCAEQQGEGVCTSGGGRWWGNGAVAVDTRAAAIAHSPPACQPAHLVTPQQLQLVGCLRVGQGKVGAHAIVLGVRALVARLEKVVVGKALAAHHATWGEGAQRVECVSAMWCCGVVLLRAEATTSCMRPRPHPRPRRSRASARRWRWAPRSRTPSSGCQGQGGPPGPA